MTDKKFWIGFVAVFLIVNLFGFLVHGLWLAPDYEALTGVMRTAAEQEAKFPYMMLAHLLIPFAFTWIYRQGRKDGDWAGQGLRFGLAIALVSSVPFFLIYHAVAQFPLEVTFKQIVGDTATLLVAGLAVAFAHK